MTGIVLALMIAATTPDAFSNSFERGVAAYQAEDYTAAAEFFEQLVASRVEDPVVFFNLGNAYYRAGRPGHAIANYERTLRMDPGFFAAQDNLEMAKAKARRNLAPPLGPGWQQALLFWAENLSFPALRLMAIFFWCLFWLCLALCVWRTVPYLRGITGVVLVVALLCGLAAWTRAHREPIAVVVEELVAARYGPDEGETVRFELFEGDHVAIDLRQDGWARVSTVDGERGWTPESGLAYVDPPYNTTSSGPSE